MRLIDADALKYSMKNAVVRHICTNTLYNTIMAVIDGSPTVQAERWIPCSERLPKRDELVLVTYKTTDRIHLCKYLDDGSENPWWSYIDDCCAWNNVVLAWMPLPKPYKGGDDE